MTECMRRLCDQAENTGVQRILFAILCERGRCVKEAVTASLLITDTSMKAARFGCNGFRQCVMPGGLTVKT